MERKTQIKIIEAIEQVPSVKTILETARETKLKLCFEGDFQQQRERIGLELKNELPGFQVSVHTIQPEINICKLISNAEIEANELFFEQCAKDYRALAERLILMLSTKLGIKINNSFPLISFNELKNSKKQIGKLAAWRYNLHGYHCGFEHSSTGQLIEVPLVFGLEFGDLDPYFFTRYIKSTPQYQPLPVCIYEDYADGVRIIETMLSLGKYERITSNINNHFGVAVTDREKIAIHIYEPDPDDFTPSRFSIRRFLGLK
ncbi:DUF6896 domain-containing protein [Mucilaginibacter paludis]|uniref:DUF6896 domain-containing protein n=1 Tax=Mucilaginibacter paludis DSM 18603 TaxID=714943 RepID=H1YDS3_9SPHI|nr:hypothetical protein [Mucilaginibacter paludis]EHQ30762.1 hypothetical protein Mucpa_6712 [Mucilaginibacter paludis DSM 18603]